MRRRVQEAMTRLGMVLPIYLLVTKCDRIVGFSEYFSGLDAEERARPLGITLPLGKARPSFGRARKADTFAPGASAVAAYSERYRAFIAGLEAWTPSRLEAERQADRRRRMFGFPQQMQALGEPLEAIVRCIFGPSRFRLASLFRGVFFVSARQRGPMTDIVMQVHRQAWNLTVAEPGVRDSIHDTSFFLEGFFRDLVLSRTRAHGTRSVRPPPPAALGGRRLRADRCHRLRAGGVLVARQRRYGTGRRERFRARLPSTGSAAPPCRRTISSRPPWRWRRCGSSREVSTTRPVASPTTRSGVSRSGAARTGSGRTPGGTCCAVRPISPSGWTLRTGRRRIPWCDPSWSGSSARRWRLLASAGDGSIDRLREVLALYLGLSDTARFDPNGLLEWAARHARGRYPLSPDAQAQIIAVVGDAFEGPETAQAIDVAAVAAARRRLRVSPGGEIHARMKASYPGTLPSVTVAAALDERAAWVFASADTGAPSTGVPGLFSEPGYYEHFLPNAPLAIRDYRSNDWLDEEATAAVSDEQVFAELGTLYARDYIAAWDRFLGHLVLRETSTSAQALQLMESLLSNDSPLDALVRLVSEHTLLPVVRGSEEKAVETPAGGVAAEGGALGTLGAKAEEAIGRQYGAWPGDEVRQAFARYHALHTGRTGDLPGLADIRSRLGALHTVMATVDGESDSAAAAFREVRRWIDDPREAEVSDLRRAAMVQPKPLRRMLVNLSDQSVAILMRSARQHLDRRWQDTVREECLRAIADRYPLDRQAETAIAPDDFEAFFAANGTIDRFFREQLGPFVDTTAGSWDERSIHGQRIGFRDDALEMFRNAITIRNAFGLHAAALGEAGFTIEPVYLDSQAMWITVETNHRTFNYRHEPPRRFRMTLAEEAVSISVTDRAGATHVSRVNVPWAWFRMFDRYRLESPGVPDQHDFTVDINGLEAVFRVSADSTVNPLAPRTLTGFRCEERLL